MPATNVLAALALLFLLGLWAGAGLSMGADDGQDWCVKSLITLTFITAGLVSYCLILGLWPLGKLIVS